MNVMKYLGAIFVVAAILFVAIWIFGCHIKDVWELILVVGNALPEIFCAIVAIVAAIFFLVFFYNAVESFYDGYWKDGFILSLGVIFSFFLSVLFFDLAGIIKIFPSLSLLYESILGIISVLILVKPIDVLDDDL